MPTRKTPFAGWRIVWTVSLAQGVGPALMGPAGVFMTQLQAEFAASRAEVSLAGPILACMMMLVGLVVGRLCLLLIAAHQNLSEEPATDSFGVAAVDAQFCQLARLVQQVNQQQRR